MSPKVMRTYPRLVENKGTTMVQGIPELRDFTIRDPRYFVIQFWAPFHDFEKKNQKKKNFSEKKIFFFLKFFFDFFFKSKL